MLLRIVVVLAVVSVASLDAQSPIREPRAESRDANSKPIQDDSFLLEEAYNQEPAVVQHISTLVFDRRISSWVYSLTDEWPVNGQRHQLSLTVPLQSSVAGNSAALGDIALNYRLQLVGSGETRLAVAPRLTVLLPTAAKQLGGGELGVQGAVASSYVATPKLVLHTNAGFTFRSRSSGVDLNEVNAGQSVIWLVYPRLNVMLEGTVTNVKAETGYTLAPGLRWAYNFASGLQIVPGLAFPVGFSANSDQRAILLYLSFEHEMPGLRK